jgi:hypothetical protein
MWTWYLVPRPTPTVLPALRLHQTGSTVWDWIRHSGLSHHPPMNLSELVGGCGFIGVVGGCGFIGVVGGCGFIRVVGGCGVVL